MAGEMIKNFPNSPDQFPKHFDNVGEKINASDMNNVQDAITETQDYVLKNLGGIGDLEESVADLEQTVSEHLTDYTLYKIAVTNQFEDVDTEINNLKQSGVSAKSIIATATSSKGVPTSVDDTWEQMGQNIEAIEVGDIIFDKWYPFEAMSSIEERGIRHFDQQIHSENYTNANFVSLCVDYQDGYIYYLYSPTKRFQKRRLSNNQLVWDIPALALPLNTSNFNSGVKTTLVLDKANEIIYFCYREDGLNNTYLAKVRTSNGSIVSNDLIRSSPPVGFVMDDDHFYILNTDRVLRKYRRDTLEEVASRNFSSTVTMWDLVIQGEYVYASAYLTSGTPRYSNVYRYAKSDLTSNPFTQVISDSNHNQDPKLAINSTYIAVLCQAYKMAVLDRNSMGLSANVTISSTSNSHSVALDSKDTVYYGEGNQLRRYSVTVGGTPSYVGFTGIITNVECSKDGIGKLVVAHRDGNLASHSFERRLRR